MKAAKGKATRAESEEAILAMASKFKLAGGDVAAPKKSYKMLIFVAIALIVVGAGAGGAWMFLMQPPDAEAEAVEAPPEVFAKAYVQTDAVHIGFTDRNGGRRRLVVFLTLEVEQRGRNVADVQQAMPRLQEAFWRSLNGEPLPGADIGAIELTAVKERVRSESERVLGPRVVHDVLIRDARVIRG